VWDGVLDVGYFEEGFFCFFDIFGDCGWYFFGFVVVDIDGVVVVIYYYEGGEVEVVAVFDDFCYVVDGYDVFDVYVFVGCVMIVIVVVMMVMMVVVVGIGIGFMVLGFRY